RAPTTPSEMATRREKSSSTWLGARTARSFSTTLSKGLSPPATSPPPLDMINLSPFAFDPSATLWRWSGRSSGEPKTRLLIHRGLGRPAEIVRRRVRHDFAGLTVRTTLRTAEILAGSLTPGSLSTPGERGRYNVHRGQ